MWSESLVLVVSGRLSTSHWVLAAFFVEQPALNDQSTLDFEGLCSQVSYNFATANLWDPARASDEVLCEIHMRAFMISVPQPSVQVMTFVSLVCSGVQ